MKKGGVFYLGFHVFFVEFTTDVLEIDGIEGNNFGE
jgi:hypothetical protein